MHIYLFTGLYYPFCAAKLSLLHDPISSMYTYKYPQLTAWFLAMLIFITPIRTVRNKKSITLKKCRYTFTIVAFPLKSITCNLCIRSKCNHTGSIWKQIYSKKVILSNLSVPCKPWVCSICRLSNLLIAQCSYCPSTEEPFSSSEHAAI